MATHEARCVVCGASFAAKRANARYCGDRCRQRAHRRPGAQPSVVALPTATVPQVPAGDGELTVATRRRLVEAGRGASELGVAALVLAARIDRLGLAETGSGMAALMREWRSMLGEALRDAKHDDPLTKIQESAALKLIAGGRA